MPQWLRTTIGLVLGVFVLGLPLWAMVASSSCSTPPTPAKVAKAAQDLCTLRAIERAVLEFDPRLQPPADSVRAKVQQTEDEFCAGLADAATPAPLVAPSSTHEPAPSTAPPLLDAGAGAGGSP